LITSMGNAGGASASAAKAGTASMTKARIVITNAIFLFVLSPPL
jgi:hypothetical protein